MFGFLSDLNLPVSWPKVQLRKILGTSKGIDGFFNPRERIGILNCSISASQYKTSGCCLSFGQEPRWMRTGFETHEWPRRLTFLWDVHAPLQREKVVYTYRGICKVCHSLSEPYARLNLFFQNPEDPWRKLKSTFATSWIFFLFVLYLSLLYWPPHQDLLFQIHLHNSYCQCYQALQNLKLAMASVL